MSYNTQQDILDFVEDNNVKFVRFAFCDICLLYTSRCV